MREWTKTEIIEVMAKKFALVMQELEILKEELKELKKKLDTEKRT